MKAYAYASGQIGFGDTVPKGALPIVGRLGRVPSRADIEAMSRRSYDGKTLLVPGVPEAPSEMAAYEAFEKWINLLVESAS
jgi:hypothetical protein